MQDTTPMSTLPENFANQMRALLGENIYSQLAHAIAETPQLSIRMNPKKPCPAPSSANTVAWASDAYYLEKRPPFTYDPWFHIGGYYVQEASSMSIELAVRQYITKPSVALDLCAAPGGKSTHLLSLLPEGSLLVSNEIIRSRSRVLSENCTKWGSTNSIVTNNAPKDFSDLRHIFDLITVDAPCSGEGMFRKDRESVNEWSPENVKLCASRQKQILDDIWNTLKPGGILVYSTCTYNTEENEKIVEYMKEEYDATPLPLDLSPEWKILPSVIGDDPVYRFMPHSTRGEGFFLAVMRKSDDEALRPVKTKKSAQKTNKKDKAHTFPQEIKTWIRSQKDIEFACEDKFCYARTPEVATLLPTLRSRLNLLTVGLQMAEIKGKEIIPSQALAMSQMLNQKAFVTHDVDRKTALRYLSKEALTLPEDLQKGHVLLTYKNAPLGFVKQLGNRANNLYPTEWRIHNTNHPAMKEDFEW